MKRSSKRFLVLRFFYQSLRNTIMQNCQWLEASHLTDFDSRCRLRGFAQRAFEMYKFLRLLMRSRIQLDFSDPIMISRSETLMSMKLLRPRASGSYGLSFCQRNMDHHEVLRALVTNDRQDGQSFDESLEKIMVNVISMLPEESLLTLRSLKIIPHDKVTVRSQYLRIVLFILKSLKSTDLSKNDTLLSVNQQKTVKAAVEIATSIGILSCLLPGIGPGMNVLCPRAAELTEEKLTDLQKYDRLSSTVRDLTDCFDEVSLRSALLPQLGPLLGALLQLSYAPLAKPSTAEDQPNVGLSSEFKMTKDLYERLTKDQDDFRRTLSRLIDDCPQATVIKEFMIILGVKNSPSWIRRRARAYLVECIVRQNGVVSLVDAVCNDVIDLGAHWDKLDTVARLLATSHGQDPDKYFDAVCSQLVSLLTSKRIKHSSTIANHCITALYENNPSVCVEKIVRVIVAPLRAAQSDSGVKLIPRTETEVSDCIENLTRCFIPTDAKFKHLPCTLMKIVAMPLFSLHVKARQSVSLVRKKIRMLLLNLLSESTLRDDLFSAFLDHERNSVDYGAKLSCRFGPTGGLEITGETENLDHEAAADSLLDLVTNEPNLAFGLFKFLLRSFSTLKNIGRDDSGMKILETSEDTMNRVEKNLASMKILSNLAGTRAIQDALKNDPEPLLTFVKSLFDEKSSGSTNDDDERVEILYVGLMLVKVILTESSKPKDWTPFNDLAKFLTEAKERTAMPQQLLDLIQEVIKVVNSQGRLVTRRYQDLAVGENSTKESEFEKALADLADPLLPVRAHGLMSLTKLIESRDPEAIAKKDIILCFFQENLKDEDSFVYLAAANGLCALASVFPEKVIETLVQEYIDMPERNSNGDITPETRAKLGEILVKTTRALGDMAPAYKNILINGFLCGTRDPDEMVRASSLSCLGELCKVLGFKLGHAITEVIYCIGCIINSDKAPECRRAAVLVANLLIRGLGKDVLTDLGSDLVPLYRALKFLRDNDDDQVLRVHAQLALEELDETVQTLLFATPQLKNRIFIRP